jgi:hypothetical protein
MVVRPDFLDFLSLSGRVAAAVAPRRHCSRMSLPERLIAVIIAPT